MLVWVIRRSVWLLNCFRSAANGGPAGAVDQLPTQFCVSHRGMSAAPTGSTDSEAVAAVRALTNKKLRLERLRVRDPAGSARAARRARSIRVGMSGFMVAGLHRKI